MYKIDGKKIEELTMCGLSDQKQVLKILSEKGLY
jgi:hypothetical protein